MPRRLLRWFSAMLLAPCLSGVGQSPGTQPVRVFVLAGQSNMEGYGAIEQADASGREQPGTLRSLLADPTTAPRFAHLVDPAAATPAPRLVVPATNAWFGDPAPGVHKQLHLEWTLDGAADQRTIEEGEQIVIDAALARVRFTRATYGELPRGRQADVLAKVQSQLARPELRWREREDVVVAFEARRGPLRTGFGANPNLFGVELQFGHVLGDLCAEPVLLVKTAWGGKSLHADFRPPSAGGDVGLCYTQLLQRVRAALADPGAVHAAWRGRRATLSGLVWWHGWNDGCGPAQAVRDYEQNLVHLIRDLRRDLGVADLPVVVAELTGPWVAPTEPEWRAIRAAQAAAAARAEWAGRVAFVPTAHFVRTAAQSPGGWDCHEFNNAETYFLVGDACGRAMASLLAAK